MKVMRWYTPAEALPADDGTVIIQIDGKAGNITFKNALMTGEYYDDEGCWKVDEFPGLTKEQFRVAAWMPMPDAYDPAGTFDGDILDAFAKFADGHKWDCSECAFRDGNHQLSGCEHKECISAHLLPMFRAAVTKGEQK